jgi:cardiolipin synthase
MGTRLGSWFRAHRVMVLVVGPLAGFLIAILMLNFAMPERRIKQSLAHRYDLADPQFRHELGTLLGPPILDGNAAINLENGEEIFPAMLQAIAAAQHTITFETYIYWSGDIGRKFS